MEEIKEIIKEIAIFLILINIISTVIPEDRYKKYIQIISGLVIILIIFNPLNKYLNENILYNSFEKIYKENEIVEMDKSLSNLNEDIVKVTINNYEKSIMKKYLIFYRIKVLKLNLSIRK